MDQSTTTFIIFIQSFLLTYFPTNEEVFFSIQDFNTFKELRGLEEMIGTRYLTHESDDEAWSRYGSRITDPIPEISFL